MKKKYLLIILTILVSIAILTLFNLVKKNKKDNSILNIANSGWSYISSDKGMYVSYGVEITNNDDNLVVKNPILKIIGKGENGDIIFQFEDTIPYVYANDSIAYGKTFKVDQMPKYVEFILVEDEVNYISKTENDFIKKSDLVITNIEEEINNIYNGYSIGLINNSSNDLEQAMVTIVYKKDDKIVGGSYSYIYSVLSGEENNVKIYTDNIPEYDDYQINVLNINSI